MQNKTALRELKIMTRHLSTFVATLLCALFAAPIAASADDAEGVTPPYTWTLEGSDCLDGFTIIDSDGDGSTWFVNGSGYVLHMGEGSVNDDWLITPAISLEASKGYSVTVAAALYIDFGSNATLSVYSGTDPSVEGMTTQLVGETSIATANSDTEMEGTLEAAEAGLYYVGVRCTSSGEFTAPILNYISIGEGEDIEIDTSIDGVTESTSSTCITTVDGSIIVKGATGESVQVYTVDGKNVYGGTSDGNTVVGVAKGLYVVKVGGRTLKVTVR